MDGVVGTGSAVAIAAGAAVLVAAAVGRLAGLGTARASLTASLRALVQLAVVALVITAVIRSLLASMAFVLVMATVATVTAARRLTPDRSGLWAGLPVAGSALPVTGLLLATGVLPPTGLAVVPVAGILVGGAMTATSLAGRRTLDVLRERRGEVEAARSLGFVDRDAAIEIARPAAALALVPALDQTRTVGLVTLPGAFVGMLLGGAGPLQAGAVQLLVLVLLLAVETVAVAVVADLVCRRVIRR